MKFFIGRAANAPILAPLAEAETVRSSRDGMRIDMWQAAHLSASVRGAWMETRLLGRLWGERFGLGKR